MPADSGTKTVHEVQSKGAKTRERILDLAYDSIVAKGFAATSIDELVESASISRSGFFYHFKDKNDLARQLMHRSMEDTERDLDEMEVRARELHEDPLHAFLIFLKFYEEMMAQLLEKHPGCIVAAVITQDRNFDPEVRSIANRMMLKWRERFHRWLTEIAAVHPFRMRNVALADLADHPNVVADGSLILAKSFGDYDLVRRQANLLRETVRLAFGA